MLDMIPEEIKALEQFLVWRLEKLPDVEKPAKIPYNPNNHWKCAVTKKENYSDFYKAKEVFKKSDKKYSGLGFGLFPSGEQTDITVIDFDNVLDQSGELLPQYEEIAEWTEDFNTYTEVSQSGNGLHLFFYGSPPGNTTRKAICKFPVEIYCKGRYIAITGNIWHGYDKIRSAQETLTNFYYHVFGKENPKIDNSRHEIILSGETGSDEKILEIIRKSKSADKFNNLFAGNGCDDNSANDQALCNMIAFYTQDYDQIIRIMNQSGLVRDKWENHKTYLKMTIEKAINGLTGKFDWQESARKNQEWLDNNKSKQKQITCEPETKTETIVNEIEKPSASAKKLNEVKQYLAENYKIYKNEVNGYVFINFYDKDKFVQFTDRERSSLFCDLQHLKISDNLLDHILKSDYVELINPIQRYFESLPKWSGQDYIAEYINSSIKFAEENTKNLNLIKKWLVGVVACSMTTDKINDLCLIFKGAQGIGKSTWFKRLLPDCLGEYYTTFNIADKSNDTALSIISSLLLDMDELNDLSKREDSEIKGLISQKTFRIRKPYDKLPDLYYRYASFCGSVNEDTFLKDSTGHRRFIVLEALKFDFDTMRTYDKNKIWSQAVGMFKAGFEFWLSQDENNELSNHNKKYSVINAESELLIARFSPADKFDGTHKLNASQLIQFLDMKKLDAKAIKNMKAALKEHGFIEVVAKIESRCQRVYLLKELPRVLNV